MIQWVRDHQTDLQIIHLVTLPVTLRSGNSQRVKLLHGNSLLVKFLHGNSRLGTLQVEIRGFQRFDRTRNKGW